MIFPANFPNPIAQAIKKYYSENMENNHMIIKTKNIYNLEDKSDLTLFINFEKTNNFIQVNKFHEKVNVVLTKRGIYCSCVETSKQRSYRKWEKSRFFLGPFILFFDFLTSSDIRASA